MSDKLLNSDTTNGSVSSLFSEEDVATLISLWEQNVSVKDIANALSRRYTNVRNKIRDLQLKGLIKIRPIGNKVSEDFIQGLSGEYQLPIHIVAHLCTLFRGGQQRVMAGARQACEAWVSQSGNCYYLRERIKLTPDDELSGVVVLYNGDELILVSKAVSQTRSSLTHHTFVSMCKVVSENFAT